MEQLALEVEEETNPLDNGSLYEQAIIAQARARMVDPDSWDPPAWYLQSPRYLSRLSGRRLSCAECGAPAGAPCEGKRGVRVSNHLTRVEAVLALQGALQTQ